MDFLRFSCGKALEREMTFSNSASLDLERYFRRFWLFVEGGQDEQPTRRVGSGEETCSDLDDDFDAPLVLRLDDSHRCLKHSRDDILALKVKQ